MVFILIIGMHGFVAYLREKLVIAVSATGFFPDCAGKKWPFGQQAEQCYGSPSMDGLSRTYASLLTGNYDCVDRIVLNGHFSMAHDPGGFRIWWRQLTGSEDTLDNAHLMRMAGRFSRRLRAWAIANRIPIRDCSAGEQKHQIEEDYLARTTVEQGLFLILVGRAQAPAWDVGGARHISARDRTRS